jgi:hypothetical protein
MEHFGELVRRRVAFQIEFHRFDFAISDRFAPGNAVPAKPLVRFGSINHNVKKLT